MHGEGAGGVAIHPQGDSEGGAEVVGSEHVVDGSGGEAASAEEGDVGGALGGDVEVVGDEEDGNALVAAQAGDGLEQTGGGGEVESGGRFVHDEQEWVADEGAGDEGALALTAGEGPEAALAQGLEAHDFEHLFEAGLARTSVEDESDGAGEDEFVDGGGDAGVDFGFLGNEADAGATGEVGSEDDFAAFGGDGAEQGFEQGAFAFAVGAEQAPEVAGVDAQVDVAEHDVTAVGEGDLFDGEDGFGVGWVHGVPFSAWRSCSTLCRSMER